LLTMYHHLVEVRVVISLSDKMKYTLLFILVSILLPVSSSAQIHGRIIDAENGKPIPYAHIYLRLAGEGTTSTIDGYFRLISPDKSDTLQVTCVGYEPFILPLSQGRDVPSAINLNPSSTILNEVVVNASGPNAEEIMRKTIDRYIANFGVDDYHMKTFMRTTLQCDGEYVHLSEADGWVYEGGAPAWKTAYETKRGFLQFTVQNEVRLTDQKYLLQRHIFAPADLNSKMLIWDADDYKYELEAIKTTDKGDALYVIRAMPAKKYKLKRLPAMALGDFFLMERVFIVRAKDFAVLEVRMDQRFPKIKDGVQTRYRFSPRYNYDHKTLFMDSVHFIIKYDVTPSGVYRPYYTHRYYEYTDTGLEDYPISPLRLTEKHELFFSVYDTSGCSIEELAKRYRSYRPYELTKTQVTPTAVRSILRGTPSGFQLNHGYVVWGKPSYQPEYWSGREKTVPPYEDKEKLFADLASLRPVEDQFDDFTPRSEQTAQRMLELYGDDPYVREVMKRQIAYMKSVYQRFFDPERDY